MRAHVAHPLSTQKTTRRRRSENTRIQRRGEMCKTHATCVHPAKKINKYVHESTSTAVRATTGTSTSTRSRKSRASSVQCQSTAKHSGSFDEDDKKRQRWADIRPRNWATFAGSDLQTIEEEYEKASKSGLGPRFGGYNVPELPAMVTRIKSNANFFKVNYAMVGFMVIFLKTLVSVSIYSNNPLPTLSVLALGTSLLLNVDCCVEAMNRVMQSSGLVSPPSCEVIYNTMGERFTSFKLAESTTKILAPFGLLVTQVVSAVFCISFCPIYETFTAVSEAVTVSLYLSIAHAVRYASLPLSSTFCSNVISVYVSASAAIDNDGCHGVRQSRAFSFHIQLTFCVCHVCAISASWLVGGFGRRSSFAYHPSLRASPRLPHRRHAKSFVKMSETL